MTMKYETSIDSLADGHAKISATIARLSPLLGTWRGEGSGRFPSITSFHYTEECVFTSNGCEPIIHFEQKTLVKSTDETNGSPLHWESGFFRALEDGSVEVSNAQNGGRVEVLKGVIDEAAYLEGVLLLKLESVLFGNDPRLIQTMRRYEVRTNTLNYLIETATVRTPERQRHLQATLEKVA